MITGVVLARNEEVNIEACLRSFRPHVDQLIVIDMESSDATTRIAERLADRVISHPLIDDFDSARNVAIQHTPHPWLWFLDADERVSPQTAGIVRNLADSLDDSFAAIQIPFKTYFCGQWIRHSGWWPGYTMPRVFRRGRFEFRKGVHQGVAVDGKTALFPPDPETAIEHFSYRSIEHYFEKFNRYTTIEAQSLVSREDASWDWRVGMRQMTRDLWHYYENSRGDLDGLKGWVLAWLAGQYRWAAHAKVLDALGDRDVVGSVPTDLSEVVREIENELSALRVGRPPVGEMGLVLRSPLLDATGYADDGRFVASVLARLEYSVQAEEIRWREDVATLIPATQALIRALLRAKTPRNRITITNCIPTLVQPDPLAHLNILRTTFETDRIPEEWLDRLDGFDEIWLFSEANREAFIRGGAAPERIRLVPSGLDTELFSTTGAKCALPAQFEQRFKILSILDWQYRKGWDILVAAVLDEFKSHRDVGLILKVTTDHGASLDQIEAAIDDLRNQLEPEVRNQVAISILAQSLTALEMAELYRAVDLFALPSRGEGWGRPLLEAMACGIPVLTTEGSGQAAFLDDSCALLVESTWCEVPDHAWHQVPTFKGHRWLEPNFSQLKQRLRQAYDEPDLRQRLAKSGLTRAREQYSIDASRSKFAHAVESAQSCWFPSPAPLPSPDRVRVAIEGEFFAGHSFSNVNEEIARHLMEWQQTELTLTPLWHEHASTTRLPHLQSLKSYFQRDIGEVDVTLRHSFPPRWDRPKTGRWIHIQPWEFGALPLDWIQPLRDDVDEIWLPSSYCRDVFVASGVPADKIQVIPWGIDSSTYHPQAIPLALPAAERFQFLFMGGTITRKGFDVLLQAYLEEFTETDQVQLVVKDMGTKSFYRDDNHRERLLQHIARSRGPKIHYIDREMTAGQRASLYNASHCLVAPYRGEGFGLPILEAMACGVMPIIPDQGPATEFVPVDASIRLPAKTQECLHGWRLAGVGTEISIEVSDLRDAMRRAYENRQLTRDMGIRAAQHAHENYSWREISLRMAARLQHVGKLKDAAQTHSPATVATAPTLTACILHDNQQLSDLIETLGSVRHWCREIIITTTHVTDDLTAIAKEYRARLYPALPIDLREHRLNSVLRRSTSDWVLWLDAGESVSLTAASEIKVRLPQLNPRAWGVALSIETLSLGQIDREVRILRNVNECLLGSDGARSPYRAVVDHAKQVIDLDAPITTSTIAPAEPFKLNRELLSDGLSIWQCERLAAALVRQGDHFHAECLFRQVFEAPSVPPDLLIRVTSELMKTSINIGDPYRAEEYRQFGHSNWPTSALFNHLPQPRLYEVDTDELKLYLGAGSKTLPGYLTVDLVPGPTVDIALDLDRCPWPWSDSSVSRIVAEDLVEHLGINLIQFCSEAWRVLRPGGLLYVRTPHCEGESSWIDPTHRWHYDTRSFEFLDPTTSWGKHHPHYTTKKWKLLTLGVRGPQNIHACLTPIK